MYYICHYKLYRLLKMIAVITGDIINSARHSPQQWLPQLQAFLHTLGTAPNTWEIYRGDEFQLKLQQPEKALLIAFLIKSLLKKQPELDIRLGIGLGDENYTHPHITQANGTAYLYSGRVFEQTKSTKQNILFKSDNTSFDDTLNLMLKLALTFMDNWSTVSAEMVYYKLNNPTKPQQEIAQELAVSQSTISQRLKRAQFELIFELNQYFAATLQSQKT